MTRLLSLLILPLFFFSSICLAGMNISPGQSPEMRKVLSQYYSHGLYEADLEEALEPAWRHLRSRLAAPGEAPLAIVLDIDETSLSNFPDLERLNFTANMEAVTAAYMQALCPPLAPTLRLYNFAIEQKVAVFFVTGRPNTLEIARATTQNLENAGYKTYESLFLLPIDDERLDTSGYKSDARQKIMEMGYEIVLNIGDQLSDLDGGFADISIKLPNPFYRIL